MAWWAIIFVRNYGDLAAAPLTVEVENADPIKRSEKKSGRGIRG